ncbi:MAG: YbaN family protein [Spirochaetales bacterium]|nr:YbaN family protein [Spirochaetales bacterium]
MRRVLLIISGIISLVLGIVGIVLPVLPTTPFLLLSAACFVRSSERLYDWLINHRVFGLYIRSYILYKAISFKAKVFTLVTLWAVILTSAFVFIDLLWLRILLVAIALAVTIHIIRFATLTEEMKLSLEEGDKVLKE